MHDRNIVTDYPGTTKPKISSDFQRDGLLRVTALQHLLKTNQSYSQPNNGMGTFGYTYDSMSNPTAVPQSASMGHLDQDREYVYDAMNRLITARLTDTQDWSAAAQRTCIYQYDDLGNRVSHKQGAASIQAYFHDRANRLTTWAGHNQVYDAAGNVITAFSASGALSYKYAYDHHNRLTSVHAGGVAHAVIRVVKGR